MKRRDFAKGAALAATGIGSVMSAAGQQEGGAKPAFKLKYGPHHGHFAAHAGDDYLDQVRFAADQGFRAWEDNGMPGRPPELQEKAGKLLDELGMTMGVFVANAEWEGNLYAAGGADNRERLQQTMKGAVEVAKRCGAKWCTIVPGPVDRRMNFETQTANTVDTLRAMCEVCEPAGLVMVLEPLNFRDHPNMFLTTVAQAFAICRAVDSPSCKILNDLYHQQIQCGNLIPNLRECWGETAYIQVGDNPGRNEPTTGEINYRNVFRTLHELGYDGVVGMEHGKSRGGKEGELALIEAYREVDSF